MEIRNRVDARSIILGNAAPSPATDSTLSDVKRVTSTFFKDVKDVKRVTSTFFKDDVKRVTSTFFKDVKRVTREKGDIHLFQKFDATGRNGGWHLSTFSGNCACGTVANPIRVMEIEHQHVHKENNVLFPRAIAATTARRT